MRVKRECVICGKEYIARTANSKYCNSDCALEYKRRTRKDPKEVYTKKCREEMEKEWENRLEKFKKELLFLVDKPKPDCPIVTWNYAIAFTLRMLEVLKKNKTISELTKKEFKELKEVKSRNSSHG